MFVYSRMSYRYGAEVGSRRLYGGAMAWLPVRGYDMLSCAIKGIGVLGYSVLVLDAYTAVCTVLPE